MWADITVHSIIIASENHSHPHALGKGDLNSHGLSNIFIMEPPIVGFD